jgi:hypothetical protein
MKRCNSVLLLSFMFLLIAGCSKLEIQPDPLNSGDDGALKSAMKHLVPFKASFEVWSYPAAPVNGILEQIVEGIGNASHLGKTTIYVNEVIDLRGFPWLGGYDIIFTAANGDQLYGVYTSDIDPSSFPELTGAGTGSFAGGSGRFEDASGDLEYKVTFNAAEGKGQVSYSGNIKY